MVMRRLDEKFTNNLIGIRGRLRNDYDWVMVVCGREGSGKSTLAINCCAEVDPTFNAERIAFNADDFLKIIKKAQKREAILFDEAGTNLYSREAMSSMNRVLTKTFMVVRQMNLFICLCIPSFFCLDSYIREFRANTLVYITKRGQFRAWNNEKTKLVSIHGGKTKSYNVPQSLRGRFSKELPSDDFKTEYLKKKRQHLKHYLKDLGVDLGGYYKLNKFAEVSGFSASAIYNYIKDGKILAKRIGGRWYIPKDEVEKIVSV